MGHGGYIISVYTSVISSLDPKYENITVKQLIKQFCIKAD